VSDNEGTTPTPRPDEPASDSEPTAESESAPDAAEASAPEPEPAEASAPEPEPATEPEPTPQPEPAAVPPPAATEWTPPPATTTDIPLGGSGYPVNLTVAPDEGQNRLWGIPFVGLTIRAILVIPQAIVLWVLALAIGFVTLFSWLPILINGRQAEFVYAIIGGYLRLATRVAGYVLLMTGRYPPFGPGGEHTIDVTFDETEEQNRLWGIPFVGLFVRWILLIPHFIVLFFIAIVVGFVSLITWIPVLVNGRTADWVVRWLGGFYRWFNRVYAYMLLLTAKYPPFRLDD
jgi:Domain of unknown function (DUF4389)